MLDALGLFDTLVPIASILTISVITVYTLPRQERLGLFFLVWWALSVAISLNNGLFTSSAEWSPKDYWGMLLLLGLPPCMLGILYLSFRYRPSIRLFFCNEVPLWSMIALHIYRLDGLSIVYPFWKGEIPKYLGFQTILLDVWIGATSIPLVWIVYTRGVDAISCGFRKDALWFWNSLGLYDLTSAYVIFASNYFQVGGRYLTTPALSMLGFHPFPLIVLFQAPLAIAIHILLLTNMDLILEHQSKGLLPLHIRRLRAQ
jgi:hypothetical protein